MLEGILVGILEVLLEGIAGENHWREFWRESLNDSSGKEMAARSRRKWRLGAAARAINEKSHPIS